jgi:hypothetical protein
MKIRQTGNMLKHQNYICFIRLGGVFLTFVNTGSRIRYRVFKNIFVETDVKAVNYQNPVLVEAACYMI